MFYVGAIPVPIAKPFMWVFNLLKYYNLLSIRVEFSFKENRSLGTKPMEILKWNEIRIYWSTDKAYATKPSHHLPWYKIQNLLSKILPLNHLK